MIMPLPESSASLQQIPEHLLAALKQQWKAYRRELKRCQKRFSESAVHQSRVETRRLLSLAELLGTFLPAGRVERIRVCLKRHLDTLDDLRDTHVQLLLARKLRDSFPEAKAFERHLRKREKRFGRQTRKNVKRIKTRRLGKLIAASRQALLDRFALPASSAPRPYSRALPPHVAPPRAVLLRTVDSAFARVADLKGRIDPDRTKTIHVTRVAFKKFRYMVESLSGFLLATNPRQLADLRRYQTLMGDVQDIEVLLRAYEKFSGKKRNRSGLDDRFRDALRHRRQQLIARYFLGAERLSSFWPITRPGVRNRLH